MTVEQSPAAPAGPPIVRIVCAYPDGALPADWFQSVRRARRALARAGWRARIDLLPASQVPAGPDVLLATPDLAPALAPMLVAARGPAAGPAAGPDPVVACVAAALPSIIEAHLARLAGEGRLTRGPDPVRAVAVHRGFLAIGERARLEDDAKTG